VDGQERAGTRERGRELSIAKIECSIFTLNQTCNYCIFGPWTWANGRMHTSQPSPIANCSSL
jgi:hypothetical protein